MTGRVAGKGIVITGAGSGMGRAFAVAFAPRVVDTSRGTRLAADLLEIGDSTEPGQAMTDFASGILRGRPATPEDLVGSALFLASSDSDYLTGAVLMADGGMVLV